MILQSQHHFLPVFNAKKTDRRMNSLLFSCSAGKLSEMFAQSEKYL